MSGASRKALVVFGTRPEAIKLAPVIRALERAAWFDVVTCLTGQHRDLVRPICDLFEIRCDYDLDIMRPGQSLTYVASAVTERMAEVIEKEKPDVCIVQGDTTTAFAAALSAYYSKVPVVHVEAGLRTWDLQSPWPEEGNRVLISRIADYHFAPTELARNNLLSEGVDPEKIILTGNTVVDAALLARDLLRHESAAALASRFAFLKPDPPVILCTMHRRESFGPVMERVFRALQQFCVTRNVQIVFPVHPNPQVHRPAHEILGAQPNIHLCEPLDYQEIIYLLQRCRFVITDSGGIVEEAATFKKPVLVVRDTTERSESVEAGSAILCGSDTAKLARLAGELLEDGPLFAKMSSALNPFGDGYAADRIVKCLLQKPRGQVVAA
jgi:UDP-N-acetylglucosamine 2-epimerase (non-hydrolysing)